MNRTLILDAQPQSIDVDLAAAAVFVVDMQNDFVCEGGLFDHAGVDVSGAQQAVTATAKVLAASRAARLPIIYLKMGYRADLSDLGPAGSVNRERHLHFGVGQTMRAPDGSEGRFLVRDTWNTAIVRELAPQREDVIIYKTRFSGFYKTELYATLQKRGIKFLIFTGVTTSICVESTVRDAMFRDYLCVLLNDCMAEPIGRDLPRSNHEASLLNVAVLFGWVLDSATFVQALQTETTAVRA